MPSMSRAGIAERCGCCTRLLRNRRGPDWSVATRVKRAVRIPVGGSGGVREPADALRYLRESGADTVAIGRGCLGNPWIFQQARSLFQNGTTTPAPTKAERGRILLQLV